MNTPYFSVEHYFERHFDVKFKLLWYKMFLVFIFLELESIEHWKFFKKCHIFFILVPDYLEVSVMNAGRRGPL